MRFEDAVKEMKKGKKFINPITKRINFLMLGNILEQIENEYPKAVICLQEIESEDWEVVEEPKKTLWDKREVADGGKGYDILNTKDVKEALKEYHRFLKDYFYDDILTEKIEEIFGKEMIE